MTDFELVTLARACGFPFVYRETEIPKPGTETPRGTETPLAFVPSSLKHKTR
jgi:hypothetical protein